MDLTEENKHSRYVPSGFGHDFQVMSDTVDVVKDELVYHGTGKLRREVILEIRDYIEVFYNWQCRQANLGYLSPCAYEGLHYKGELAA